MLLILAARAYRLCRSCVLKTMFGSLTPHFVLMLSSDFVCMWPLSDSSDHPHAQKTSHSVYGTAYSRIRKLAWQLSLQRRSLSHFNDVKVEWNAAWLTNCWYCKTLDTHLIQDQTVQPSTACRRTYPWNGNMTHGCTHSFYSYSIWSVQYHFRNSFYLSLTTLLLQFYQRSVSAGLRTFSEEDLLDHTGLCCLDCVLQQNTQTQRLVKLLSLWGGVIKYIQRHQQ